MLVVWLKYSLSLLFHDWARSIHSTLEFSMVNLKKENHLTRCKINPVLVGACAVRSEKSGERRYHALRVCECLSKR